MRRPDAVSAAAAKRTVEDLPFVPTTWIASSSLLRSLELVEQRRDALEAELHPERGERLQIAAVTRRRRRGGRAARPPPARSARPFRAPPRRDGGRPLDEARVRELLACALDLALGLGELLLEPRPQILGAAGRQHRAPARRPRRSRRRRATRRPAVPWLTPPSVSTSPATGASGQPCTASGARGASCAPARSWRRLDDEVEGLLARLARSPRRARRRRRSGHVLRASTVVSPSSPQMRSVTCGSTGCARRRVAPSTCSSVSETLAPRGGVLAVEAGFRGLEIPVADVVPDEAVERLDGRREVVGLERGGHLGGRIGELAEHPRVDRLGARGSRRGLGIHVEEDQARGVPELVAEPAALLDRALGEAHVLRRAHLEQAVARGVGAVLRRSDRAGRCRSRATSTSAGRRPRAPSGG